MIVGDMDAESAEKGLLLNIKLSSLCQLFMQTTQRRNIRLMRQPLVRMFECSKSINEQDQLRVMTAVMPQGQCLRAAVCFEYMVIQPP
jgi:hypothetical protein